MPKMYSSEELEGMSIQAYCSRNNVPYKALDRWIKDIYKRVVPVQITGTPEETKMESPQMETEQKKKPDNDNVSIKVNISTSSGIELSKDGLDYNGLRAFIKKLEGLLC